MDIHSERPPAAGDDASAGDRPGTPAPADGQHGTRRRAPRDRFTRREAALVAHLEAHRGRVVPRQELMTHVWGRVTRSLDVHVRRVRRKLGPSGPVIETVFKVGYRFVEPQTVTE
ncbi:MAG: winged helix-turn-helix domain-containing protein [Vicinamibacterales bacterium]